MSVQNELCPFRYRLHLHTYVCECGCTYSRKKILDGSGKANSQTVVLVTDTTISGSRLNWLVYQMLVIL